MNVKVGELTSQIRNITKALKQDNLYISDRLIYSLIKKRAAPLLYQEDSKMKIMKMPFLFTPITMELIEVDKVEADCIGVKSDCVIKRTKNPLPETYGGYWGPLIFSVTSLDGEQEVLATRSRTYVRKSSSPDFKYIKDKYYWPKNGYLYFPDNEWDAVTVEAAFEEQLTECGDEDICINAQDMELHVPKYLLSSIQDLVLQDLSTHLQIPVDSSHDKQNISR